MRGSRFRVRDGASTGESAGGSIGGYFSSEGMKQPVCALRDV